MEVGDHILWDTDFLVASTQFMKSVTGHKSDLDAWTFLIVFCGSLRPGYFRHLGLFSVEMITSFSVYVSFDF